LINNKNNLLASLAVFRKLYDTENKDIYEVIGAFITDIINNENLKKFSLSNIQYKLNTNYEFDLPLSIIKTSIKRLKFISRQDGNYYVNPKLLVDSKKFINNQKKIIQENQIIIDNLIKYIEKEKNEKLNINEKCIILENFCNFLIDKNNGNKYLEYITSYLIKNENNVEFNKQLNLIREGVILYTGIKFNNNISELGSWSKELTIFLETDILFDIAGYNGSLYQTIILDLLNLIQEINSKKNKQLITLKYFEKTEHEINDFFYAAEHVLGNKSRFDPTKTAMCSILEGCKTASDIIIKKSKFNSILNKHKIQVDTFDEYFENRNQKFNILSKESIKIFNTKYERDITDCLKCLNYISILRGIEGNGNDNDFENIKYILLSENFITSKIAWNELRTNKEEIPLAINIQFLTNKFWFKLNKGFGDNILPKSLNIISKSQMVLSNILKENIINDFQNLQESLKKGDLNEKQVSLSIVQLRKQIRKPEDIIETNLDEVLSEITENQLRKFVEEQEMEKIRNSKLANENSKLKEKITELSQKNKNSIEEIEYIKINLQAKEDEYFRVEEKKIKDIRIKANNNKFIKKCFHFIIILSISIVLPCIINYFNSEKINIFLSIFISLFLPAIAIIFDFKSDFYSNFMNKQQKKYIRKKCNKIYLSEEKYYDYENRLNETENNAK
jgi:hypothetical protein